MIERCVLCEREFELDEQIPIHSGNNRLPKMYRIDGIVHQFPFQTKKKSAFPGAFAVPPRPKPEPEPPAVIETEVTAPVETLHESVVTVDRPDVETMAEVLENAWHNPEIQPGSLSFAESQTLPGRWSPPSDERATDLIGEVIDGKVVSWNTNILGYRSGFIRTEKYGKSRGSLFFKEEDVITVGRIGVGSHVRCLVCDSNGKSLEAREVEIYLEEKQ